jgi:scaffold protein (connect acetoacetyl-CoA thiolase and HMG-CoA synthase)
MNHGGQTRAAAQAAGKLLAHAWRQDGDQVSLLATRCRCCGTLTFPPPAACPRCWQRDGLCEELLAQPGTVAAYTVVHVPAEGIAAPYALAYVDFDGGVRLCGRLDSWQDIAVGDLVTAVAGVLRSQPGGDLLGWLFQKAKR